MTYVKSKLHTRLNDNHLDSVLLLATSSLQPEIETLSKVWQQQPSHEQLNFECLIYNTK